MQRYPVDSALVHGQAHCARFVIPSGENLDLVREEPQAFILDRVGYVDSFAKDAKEAGARYLMSHRVAAVWRDNGTIKVGLAPQSTSSILEARAVVVVSGFGTSLVQGLGMKMEKDFVTGIQSEVIAPSLDRVHVYFGRDVAPGFFAWLVPTSGGRALVGLLSRRHAQHYMERLLARLKDEDKVAGVIKGPHQWGIPLKPLPRTFGDRVVVVGDAAGQVKPTPGGGIYYSREGQNSGPMVWGIPALAGSMGETVQSAGILSNHRSVSQGVIWEALEAKAEAGKWKTGDADHSRADRPMRKAMGDMGRH